MFFLPLSAIFHFSLSSFHFFSYLCSGFQNHSESSAVGSVPRSGRGGRLFESDHPDKKAGPKDLLFYSLQFYMPAELFQIPCVSEVKGGQLLAVDVQNGRHGAVFEDWNYDFAAGECAAGNVSREFVHIFNYNGLALFPCCAAYPLPISDAGAGNRPLERSQYQFFTGNLVKAAPKEAECLRKGGSYVGKIGHDVTFSLNQTQNLRQKFLVFVFFPVVIVDIQSFHRYCMVTGLPVMSLSILLSSLALAVLPLLL